MILKEQTLHVRKTDQADKRHICYRIIIKHNSVHITIKIVSAENIMHII